MGLYAKGQVVVAPLVFSDFSGMKRRPALVVATPDDLDPILCMITSRPRNDGFDIPVTGDDFSAGGLRRDSYVRVCHLFTIDARAIDYGVGTLRKPKMADIVAALIDVLSR